MAYKHNLSLHKRQRQARKLHSFTIVAFVLVFLAVGAVAVDWVITGMRNDTTVVTTEQTRSVQASNISIYRTQYFQFQATDDWVEIDDSSYNGERYIYVKNKGSLQTQRLTVYVNRSALEKERDIKNNYVLPVDIGPLGRFINIGTVSEHCSSSWLDSLPRNPTRIRHDDVSFVCAPDSQEYNIVIGERGDDENILVRREDGTTSELTIVYSDLTAYPSPGDVYSIIESFVAL